MQHPLPIILHGCKLHVLLWDKTYIENSWISQWGKTDLPLIPKLMQSINKYFPGTKLAFTEFNYGGANDISGAIAIDDVLGIFAKYGVYFAALWKPSDPCPFISAAYEIYRNYDGSNSTFGDHYLTSGTSDSVNCSIYASTAAGSNQIHLIVINKNFGQNITGNFSVSFSGQITSGRVWELNQNSSSIQEIENVTNISNNSFSYTIKAASVCHFVLQSQTSIESVHGNISPNKFELTFYPNPFNPICRIKYSIPENSIVKIQIYSAIGILVKSYNGS